MTIDWIAFTPVAALGGGLLIGVATAVLLLGLGRIAGIAGIVASPLRAALSGASLRPEATRLAFIGGLLITPWIWRLLAPWPEAVTDVPAPWLVVAGLLVGVGVRMGNGCTSGHGVCGLSRFSVRSLANVMAFMGAGFVTVALLRHAF